MAGQINGLYHAVKIAQQAIKAGKEFETYGITEGQILYSINGRLTMEPCWFSIIIGFDHRLVFNPLVPYGHIALRNEDFLTTALGEEFLETITTEHYAISGKTAWHHNSFSDSFWIDPYIPIWPQVQRVRYLLKSPALKHNILENSGDLVINNHTLLQLPKPKRSYMDKFDYYIRDYDGVPVWTEPSREYKLRNPEKPAPEFNVRDEGSHEHDDESEYDELMSRSYLTDFKATLVPTLWIKDNKTPEGEFFLDFAGNWTTLEGGSVVSIEIGKFDFSHKVKDEKMTTRTSLWVADSILYQKDPIKYQEILYQGMSIS